MKKISTRNLKLRHYRSLSVAILLTAPLMYILFAGNGKLAYVMAGAVCILSILAGTGYRCPNCRTILDIRMNADDLHHCPKCATRLDP